MAAEGVAAEEDGVEGKDDGADADAEAGAVLGVEEVGDDGVLAEEEDEDEIEEVEEFSPITKPGEFVVCEDSNTSAGAETPADEPYAGVA